MGDQQYFFLQLGSREISLVIQAHLGLVEPHFRLFLLQNLCRLQPPLAFQTLDGRRELPLQHWMCQWVAGG